MTCSCITYARQNILTSYDVRKALNKIQFGLYRVRLAYFRRKPDKKKSFRNSVFRINER